MKENENHVGEQSEKVHGIFKDSVYSTYTLLRISNENEWQKSCRSQIEKAHSIFKNLVEGAFCRML